MTKRVYTQLIAAVGFCICFVHDARTQESLGYTAAQAQSGETAYAHNCAQCHGNNLKGGAFAPALVGDTFVRHWAASSVGRLLSTIETTMPPGSAGTLPRSTYVEIIAYLLEAYGVKAGATALPSDPAALDSMLMPTKEVLEVRARLDGSLLASGITLPNWPLPPNPLDRITPISEEELDSPPETSWLSWRRTRDAGGFSPLKQISRENVVRLRVAWTLALPPGPNESTPLVHDGVMFIQSYGGHIQALDASSGDELWHHYHELPRGTPNLVNRNIALYKDKLYFSTSDARVVALRMKTGEVVWEQSVGDARSKTNLSTTGPLIARDVVMQGVLGSVAIGGGYVAGLNADTGALLWRFYTLPKPGEPDGDSWNGLPWEKRSGGSIWTAGSYDADENVALFGPSPTYDIEPLRKLSALPGVTNAALYTNTTIALEPQTGRLVWHYQHLPNDQWDLDWAFERQIVSLPLNDSVQRLVLTAGKQAIYDALDARTGRYLFSMDLGLQNLVKKIDSKTGTKTIDPKLNDSSKLVTICPHMAGAKSWLPGSYDPTNRMLYVPLVESCMDVSPARRGYFGKGQDFDLRPRPDSDGRYGRLEAISLDRRRSIWKVRQRAPQTTGVLVTAGHVLFAGALDRWFTAYAADSGERLWGIRLSDVPNSAPISYAVNGKQYIAMVAGAGYGQALAYYPLVPEIRPPAGPSGAVWVFTLDD